MSSPRNRSGGIHNGTVRALVNNGPKVNTNPPGNVSGVVPVTAVGKIGVSVAGSHNLAKIRSKIPKSNLHVPQNP